MADDLKKIQRLQKLITDVQSIQKGDGKKITVGQVLSAVFDKAEPSSHKFISSVAEISGICEDCVNLVKGMESLPGDLKTDTERVLREIQRSLAYDNLRSAWIGVQGVFTSVPVTTLSWVAHELHRIEFAEVLDQKRRSKTTDTENDTWEPLQIDRETPEYKEAIDTLEKAVEVVEQDNGYNANEPDERNQMVSSLKEGLTAIKERMPSRQQLISVVGSTLRHLSTKFSNMIIGDACSTAYKAFKAWLSTL